MLPEALIAALFVPPLLFLIGLRRGDARRLRPALLSFAVIYALLVGSAIAQGVYLDAKLASFDLDGGSECEC